MVHDVQPHADTEMYSFVMEGTGKTTWEENVIDSNTWGQGITSDLLLKKNLIYKNTFLI